MQPRPPHDGPGDPAGYVGRRRPDLADERPADFLYGRRDDAGAEHGCEHGANEFNEHNPDYLHGDDIHGDDIHGDDIHGDGYRPAGKRRRSALIAAFSAVIVVVLAIGGFVVIRDVIGRFGGGSDGPTDFTGTGTTAVSVVVPAGATTTDIATILADAGVVASASLFLDVAAANPASTGIQPGTYQLKERMSSVSALALMLDPASRTVTKVVIPEGYRIDQVVAAIAEVLQLDPAAVAATAADRAQVSIPAGFEAATSLEGMLFPATYDFAPGTSAQQALQAMTGKFSEVIAQTGFIAKAKAIGVTPYEALKVASMAEAEAANFADWSKVARVIYNRTDRGEPLGIDATSLYEARLKGLDPLDIDYNAPTPFNTRRTPGFPPTPIGNPGQESLRAAVEPAAGNWLYYVVTDANGGMSFTDDFAQFEVWAQQCADNKWANC